MAELDPLLADKLALWCGIFPAWFPSDWESLGFPIPSGDDSIDTRGLLDV